MSSYFDNYVVTCSGNEYNCISRLSCPELLRILVAQKVSHYQMIKKSYYLVSKSVN